MLAEARPPWLIMAMEAEHKAAMAMKEAEHKTALIEQRMATKEAEHKAAMAKVEHELAIVTAVLEKLQVNHGRLHGELQELTAPSDEADEDVSAAGGGRERNGIRKVSPEEALRMLLNAKPRIR